MTEIITMGEILVEVMAKEVGQRFEDTAEFVGPFPSGAPAIFIDQVAKTGSRAGIISRVGNDAFGRLNIAKLKGDGVDTSYISVDEQEVTGVAFVTYKLDGDRDFIFHLKHSASAFLTPAEIVEEMFVGCRYFHVMGSSLVNEQIMQAFKKAIGFCKQHHVTISFDPNIRKEILNDERLRAFFDYMLQECDIFLPGQDELALLTGMEDEQEAVDHLLAQGKQYIVVKKGSRGCSAYSQDSTFVVAPIQVDEIDPTGAGDCFGGTLISCLNQGLEFKEAVELANIAGALAVSKKGPMEGNSTLSQLKDWKE